MPQDGRRVSIAAPTRLIESRQLENWVVHRLGSLEHERRVADLATNLFTLTQRHHGLDGWYRRLLHKAAIVHDVGRSVDVDRHPQVGARMVMDAGLPLTPFERRALAYLTRYHRGTVPEAGEDGVLASTDPHDALRVLLALLRAADALDSRSLGSCELALTLRGNRLKVHCHLDDDHHKARKILSKRKKFRLLEDLLGLRVKVAVTTDPSEVPVVIAA